MANQLSSNVSTKVAKVFAAAFESDRVLSKTVDTKVVAGANGVKPDTGDTVYLKRTPIYKAIETSDGDITGETKNDIGVGRIAATVQNFITVPIEYTNLEEVTQLDQLQELLSPAAEAMVNQLELNIGQKLIENAGLSYGDPDTAVSAWSHVVGMGALASAIGMPKGSDGRYYVMNDFVASNLASAQTGLTAADQLVRTAWENAQISTPFAGVRALTSNCIKTYTSGAASDRAGTLAATPTATFAAHKDTQIQTLSLTGLSASTANAVRPGDILEFPARHYINVQNKQVVLGADGAPVNFRMTVVTGGNTDGSGAVTVTATNAAIYGASGGADEQFATIDSPLTSGDVVNVLGTASTIYQPNLFYHKSAFALATIPLPRLHATDMMIKSKDGLQIRISKYSDGDANKQLWRADMLPVMGVVNPLFIGKSFGVSA